MRLFDLHCDTITELYGKKGQLKHNGGHISLDRAEYLEEYVQDFAVFIPDELRGEEAVKYFDGVYGFYKEQLLEKGWKEIYKIFADESLYVYKGTDATLPDDDFAGVVRKSSSEQKIDLFETFTVDAQADISKLGGAKVTITAFAIQGDVNDTITDSCTLAEIQQLWNIVSDEFTFETVIIPDEDLGKIDPSANP